MEQKNERVGYWFCFLRRVFRVDDSDMTATKKKHLTYLVVYSFLIFCYLFYAGYAMTPPVGLFAMPGAVASAVVFVHLMVTRSLQPRVIEGFMYMVGLSVILLDYKGQVLLGSRVWPSFVILLDVTLTLRLPPRVSRNMVCLVITWLLVNASEQAFRWGLYDIVTSIPEDVRARSYDCASPPCARGIAVGFVSFSGDVAVFVLDFYITRSFARGLFQEQKAMQNVITTAEWIASCLSRFDLESAEQALNISTLPPPLHDAFTNILRNLHSYKPYLPQSALQEEEEEDCKEENTEVIATSLVSSRALSVLSLSTLDEKNVSYTVSNLLGSHELVADTAAYMGRFEAYITAAVDAVGRHKGVVGVVVGDHVHASFNAVKRCAAHAGAGVEAALALHSALLAEGIEVVTGVSSGTAYCGPLGSKELLSFCVIGRAAVHASAMERFGRWHGLSVTCTGDVYKEVSFAFRMKLVVAAVTVRGGGGQVLAYEVLLSAMQSNQGSFEWMYELEANMWEVYNEGGKALLMGRDGEAERLLNIRNPHVKPPEVTAAEVWLMRMIKNNETVPSCVL